ncbi:MAG: methionyl-tRNA formyltransferase [Candidatus Vogelbacteria bacterium RIFOXYD1_FULL_44_32]|uniref:methionyl-tRNA formyltransferase n=1 Tax=Candidatus Vogelbacteria bacterium RIFOXYD1_FULL_44_32 TaxID=1802438 RepID=A0A1G2QCA0_9BACT|nr:MAG: methionyl-tRNA formyltransferase [Candidatus Vogelbacteria bacterium RIFOXYD1_FULL_44_32]
MINFAFFGTDQFATAVLDELFSLGVVPTLIVTTPDKPQGRKMTLTPPPVKMWAKTKNIPFIQPVSLKTEPEILLAEPAYELALVASYGKILPQALLDLPRLGFVNIHPSLIPKYRGATPLEASILSGDTETGVTLMQVDAEMDHGPILAQEKFPLTDQDYFALRDQTAMLGAQMFARILPDFVAGKIRAVAQDHTLATFTTKIKKTDGVIDLTGDPIQNYRKIRAYADWPGTYFFVEKDSKKMRILIKKAHLENGQLILDRVLPEGKKEMGWSNFQK